MVSASTPRCSVAPAASAPVADLVVMVQGADAVTVVRRGLDGGDAQHGQSEGGGDQLVHGRSFEMRISNAGEIRPAWRQRGMNNLYSAPSWPTLAVETGAEPHATDTG